MLLLVSCIKTGYYYPESLCMVDLTVNNGQLLFALWPQVRPNPHAVGCRVTCRY